MRHVVPKLLLIIFLLKLGGYDVFFWLVKRQVIADERSKAWTLSREEKLQHLTIPMPLPYMQPASFESIGSFFEYKGEFLRVVDLHWESDSLHLTYYRDSDLQQISDTLEKYRSAFDDHESSSPFKIPPGFLKEYHVNSSSGWETKEGWSMVVTFSAYQRFAPVVNTLVETPPPKNA